MCKVNVKLFAYILFYTSFSFNLICNMATFNFVLPFNLTPGSRVCVRVVYLLAWCSLLPPVNWICNMTTFNFVLPFDPTPDLRVCVRVVYLLAWCSMLQPF